MSQAETSLARVKPRIAPLRPRTIAISGSAAVNVESRRRPMGSPWATHRQAVALKKSSGPLRRVDAVVDAGAFLAEVGAAAVGDAGAPHLRRRRRAR